ncbi:hypothetical protein [Nostoc sp.]
MRIGRFNAIASPHHVIVTGKCRYAIASWLSKNAIAPTVYFL